MAARRAGGLAPFFCVKGCDVTFKFEEGRVIRYSACV